jgi:hypothetical protein
MRAFFTDGVDKLHPALGGQSIARSVVSFSLFFSGVLIFFSSTRRVRGCGLVGRAFRRGVCAPRSCQPSGTTAPTMNPVLDQPDAYILA